MTTFKTFFEDMTSSACLGSNPSNSTNLDNADWFAPGDARVVKGKKTYSRRGILRQKRKYVK